MTVSDYMKNVDTIKKSKRYKITDLNNEIDGKKIAFYYDIGKTDSEITKLYNANSEKNIYTNDVCVWRRANGLKQNVSDDMISNRYALGKTDSDIARELSISVYRVQTWRKANKLKKMPIDKEELKNMIHISKSNIYQIADKLCVYPEVIKEFLSVYDIEYQRSEKNTAPEWEDPESLFCDGDFLEELIGKKIKT